MLITYFKVPEFNTNSTPKLLFYTDEEMDPWSSIIDPDWIKITNSSIQSIFFNKEFSLNKTAQQRLWEGTPVEKLSHYTKVKGKK